MIYAFGGSALFATSYFVVQRTCKVRLFSDTLSAFTFWGWRSHYRCRRYYPAFGHDLHQRIRRAGMANRYSGGSGLVAYLVNFLGTIAKRKVSHIYVANWFYAAFIIMIAILYIGNNLAVPVTLTKSYSIYAGTIDAMVQWWWGHNAVGFFLTAGFLGIMYYFVPKANRPPCLLLSFVHRALLGTDFHLCMGGWPPPALLCAA